MWSRLLVPTDFSEEAHASLEMAVDIARQTGAELHVLHVVDVDAVRASKADFAPTSTEYAASMDHYADHLAHTMDPHFDAWLGSTDLGGLRVVRHTALGGVVETVLAQAIDLDVDALVLVTHGRRGVSRFFLGSIAEEIIRRSDRPVLTVRRHEMLPPPVAEAS